MKVIYTLLGLVLSIQVALAQMAPDFTIMDSQGNSHTLYADYLNQGKVVVLKFFFSTCPPCNAGAPAVQQLYEDYGSGNGDMQLIELTTQSWDNNSNVLSYVNQHGLTMPVSGADRGGADASLPYRTGQFGSFFGTPSYAVIEPDGTVNYPVFFNNMRTTLDNLLGSAPPQSTSVSITLTNAKTGAPIDVDGLQATLKPANAAGPTYDVMGLTGGTLAFEYPSANFPEIDNPIIVFSSMGEAESAETNSLDLVTMGRHILALNSITDPLRLQAADVNGSGTITGADVVTLRDVLLGNTTEFPNGVPSYVFLPEQVPLMANPGGTTAVTTQVLKMGDTTID